MKLNGIAIIRPTGRASNLAQEADGHPVVPEHHASILPVALHNQLIALHTRAETTTCINLFTMLNPESDR